MRRFSSPDRRCLSCPLFLFALLLVTPATARPESGAEETRLLRFPDVFQERVAFVYAGDIWLVEASGGVARRLTSDEGLELFPKFSPDGRWIAFSGEYSGTRQVFAISVDGGTPRQLTYYNDVGPLPPRGGFDNQVLGWTPDGEQILFRANRLPWSVRMGLPYLVPAEGGMETPLGVPEGGGGMLAPDGTRFVYTPVAREFRHWKRYRGGRAQDVWVFDLATGSAEQITDSPATDNQPVWLGGKIYFTSDREEKLQKLNLYAYDPEDGSIIQVTHHEEYDVLWPSAGPRRIVYENGGSLYLFDPASGVSERIPIRVYGDLPHTWPRFVDAAKHIESMDLSPTGRRAVFAARGELFTAPAEKGEIRNISRTPGEREIDAAWSPDGRSIAYLSDRSGEYELYVESQDGAGEARRITRDGDIWRFPPRWSPDGEKLAFADKRQTLRYAEVATGRVVEVDRGRRNDITTYRWSPDSRWLVYTKVGDSQLSSIWLYSLERQTAHQLTGEMTHDLDPVFDPKGRYLYFLSRRDFDVAFSSLEFNYMVQDATRVYIGVLAADGPAPFLPESDEEGVEAEGKPEATDDEKEIASPEPVRIDIEGFEQRVQAVPGESGAYRDLAAIGSGPLYVEGRGEEAKLQRFDLGKREEKTLLSGVDAYTVSADGKKLLYRKGDSFGIVDAETGQGASGEGSGEGPAGGLLKLDRMELKVDPRIEWAQMYVDAWRIVRDWFYDPGLHGVDWDHMRRRYGELVPHVAHRADLDYIFGELVGELNAGHTYVNSGDQQPVERRQGGLLGAEIEAADEYFRIREIFAGENWHESFRSPLTEPGVEVEVGDYILAVDGLSTRGVDNFYRLLESTAGRTVTLLVNDAPRLEGARQARVRPTSSEAGLRYLSWVQSRMEYVARASDGRIGYIHLPNTAERGNWELFKLFYPQARREALIVDVRYNGGGFVPDRMIELLDRPVLNYWVPRGVEPVSVPLFSHQGPKICLINGYSASGGDAFPYYFRKRGLGKLVGTRTWGGLIGLSGNPALVDGGSIDVPTFRFLDTEGMWAVENVGVSPDIEVVDRPDLVTAGRDPSLERAVEELLRELESSPPPEVEAPEPFRDPSFDPPT